MGTGPEWNRRLTDWPLTFGPDGRIHPVVVSHGNHEDLKVVQDVFNLDYDYLYYAMNFHDNLFRLYVLRTVPEGGESNLSEIGGGQLEWWEEQCELNRDVFYWNAVMYHIPMFPQGHYSYEPEIANLLMPVMEEYKFRLAMESHTHIHKVSYPIVMSEDFFAPGGAVDNEDRFIRDDGSGITCIGEGNWGAPFRRYTTKQYEWVREIGGPPGSFQKWGSFFFCRLNKEQMEITTVVLENEDRPEQLLDNEPGSCLPAGITYYDASLGNPNEELSLKICREGIECLQTDTFDCEIIVGINENIDVLHEGRELMTKDG